MESPKFIMPTSLLDETPPTALRPIRVHAEEYPESAAAVAPHSHPVHGQLLAPTSGVIRISTDEGYWMVPPGMALLLPPRIKHAVHCPRRTRMHAVVMAATALTRSPEPACQVITVNALLGALIDAMSDMPHDYEIPSPPSRMVDVFADHLACARPQPYGLKRPRDSRLRRVTDALAARPGDMRQTAGWGGVAGASPRTLERLFQSGTGVSLANYRP